MNFSTKRFHHLEMLYQCTASQLPAAGTMVSADPSLAGLLLSNQHTASQLSVAATCMILIAVWSKGDPSHHPPLSEKLEYQSLKPKRCAVPYVHMVPMKVSFSLDHLHAD